MKTSQSELPGLNAMLSFTGSASDKVSIQLTWVTFSLAQVSVKKPDGSHLLAPTAFGRIGKTVQVTLPSSGKYTFLVDPFNEATGGSTVTAGLVT